MTKLLRLVAAALAVTAGATATAEDVVAVLQLKQRVSMEELARRVSDPQSNRYGQFYTSEEIRDLAGPSDQDYQAELTEIQKAGFKVVGESKTHLWVSISGPSALFQNVFSTQIEEFMPGVRQQMNTARIPGRLRISDSLVGLDNTRQSHPKYQFAADAIDEATGRPSKTAKQPAGLTLTQIKSAYQLNQIYTSGASAKGQTIAIAGYGAITAADITKFYSTEKISPAPTVTVVTVDGKAAFDINSAVENELDIEFSGMLAPGASIRFYGAANNGDAGEVAMFTKILDDGTAKVVNYSWGDCEKNVSSDHAKAMNTIYQRAVAQGINIMVASGDSGAESCYQPPQSSSSSRDEDSRRSGKGSSKGGGKSTAPDTSIVADFPAANPYVVAVGGTTLKVSGSSRTETAWSCPSGPSAKQGCSGGGISELWTLPTFQSKLGSPFVKRSYPDVSFNADPETGESIYISDQGQQGQMAVIGGTSMATPQWVGILTMVNAAREKAGKAQLPYLNTILYKIPQSQLSSVLKDVTSGSNHGYNAGPGFDAVTGLGTPNGYALYEYLVKQ